MTNTGGKKAGVRKAAVKNIGAQKFAAPASTANAGHDPGRVPKSAGAIVGRCTWAGALPLYCDYHDHEWGVPERDSRALWEKLMLDGFQAGLAWITILRKRDAFRTAFAGFDPDVVARFGEADLARLLGDAGIVRSRAKIEATIGGARAYLAMREKGEDFASFVWSFVDGKPIDNTWQHQSQVPAETALSQQMSKALKARGFKFVGPVIVYAWMQATGLVNDHVVGCFRHKQVNALRLSQ